jgi:outer membrane protein assembly factor BamB
MTTMNRREMIAAMVAADWPQFRGPHRDGISAETGLLRRWADGQPRQEWKVDGLGEGYGSMAVSGGRIYVQGALNGRSGVHCLEAATGKKIWFTPLGSKSNNDRGNGPRSTPTVEGERLWALTESGDLAMLEAGSGKIVWAKNIIGKDFKGQQPYWLMSESPLVEGDKLIVTPGAPGATLVALDKSTGKWLWSTKELSDPPGYSSVIAFNVGSVRCLAALTARAGVGVRASDGKLMWSWDKPANRTANCAAPVFADNKVFYTSAYGTGGGAMQLTAKGDIVEASELYFTRDMMNHHGGVVHHDGYLYGFSNSILTCMKLADGQVAWRDRSVGKGCVTLADGMLFLLGESNVAGLAEASPAAYKELGRFTIPDQGRPSWAYPVVSGGKLFIRHQGLLMCFNVKA